MKPDIGTTVYVIYEQQSIDTTEVFAVGNECFFTKDFAECDDVDAYVFKYEDYGKTWFTSSKEAIRVLEEFWKDSDDQVHVEELWKGYWEVVEDE